MSNDNIQTITFALTSTACPEQYDISFNGKIVGYFRLRSGHWFATAIINNADVYARFDTENIVAEGNYGDSYCGCFANCKDRLEVLTTVKLAILNKLVQISMRNEVAALEM